MIICTGNLHIQFNEWMRGWVDGRIDGWMSRWVDEQMDEWMNRWTNG